MKVLVVVQARASSTRLPGKVLLPLGGQPLLARMLERLRAVKTPIRVCVATTTDSSDDRIAELAAKTAVDVVRGHPTDLLDRHVQAARAFDADAVAKIPSDCPLIDPAVVDRVLGSFLEEPRCDYVSNIHPATWPDGFDVEVMTRTAIETAHREATRPHEREHTTPFLWDRPERFHLRNVAWDRDVHLTHRLTIDYAEDYAVIRAVFDALHRDREPPFAVETMVEYLDAHPDVFAINRKYAGVNWYRHHLGELRTVDAAETRWPTEDGTAEGAPLTPDARTPSV